MDPLKDPEQLARMQDATPSTPLVVSYACSRGLTVTSGYLRLKNTIDYTLNPYTGCLFGCSYCFVAKSFRFRHKRVGMEKWGSWLLVKENIPRLLTRDLKLLQQKGQLSSTVIRLSSVTDPYQPVEPRFGITRQCLEILIEYPPGQLYLQTKSDLVLEDTDLLQELSGHLVVAVTINTDREDIASLFEPRAPSLQRRLHVLEKLKNEGIKTRVIASPILPSDPEKFSHLVKDKADSFVLKTIEDDGSGGCRLRPEALRIMQENGLEEYFEERFYEKVYSAFLNTIDEEKVGFGQEGFVTL
ncbi:MAG: radical SAM protein [Candidatus Odinarchaeota archaeon]